MSDDDIHHSMHYHTGQNIDILPFDATGSCEPGGLYFATVDEMFEFINYGNYIREATISDDEPVYVEWDKLKAHTIYLGERTPLWAVKTFSKLIHEGADIHADVDYALRRAAEYGHLEVVKFLIFAGVNVHSCNDGALRQTIVHPAMDYRHIKIAEFLISAGADISVLTKEQKKKLGI